MKVRVGQSVSPEHGGHVQGHRPILHWPPYIELIPPFNSITTDKAVDSGKDAGGAVFMALISLAGPQLAVMLPGTKINRYLSSRHSSLYSSTQPLAASTPAVSWLIPVLPPTFARKQFLLSVTQHLTKLPVLEKMAVISRDMGKSGQKLSI